MGKNHISNQKRFCYSITVMKTRAYLLLVVLFLIYIGTGSSNSVLGSAWPAISADISTPISWQGILIVIIYGMACCGSASAKNIVLRFHSWIPAIFGISVAVIVVFVFSTAQSFLVFVVFGVAFGYIYGLVGPVVNGYIARHYNATAMNWLHCSFAVGCMIGPSVVSYFMTNMGSWRLGYRGVGIIEICILAILLASFPLWKIHGPTLPGRKGNLGPVLPDPLENHDPALSGREGKKRGKTNAELFRVPSGAIITLHMFAFGSFEVSIFSWTTSFLTTEKGMEPGEAAAMMAFFFGAQFSGRLISGFISMKVSDRMIVRTALVVILGTMVAFIFAPASLMAPILVILGMSSGPVFPMLIHEVPSIVGEENAQGVIGLQLSAANLGNATVPVLIGVIAGKAGFKVFPVFLIVLIILSNILKAVQDRGADKRKAAGAGE